MFLGIRARPAPTAEDPTAICMATVCQCEILNIPQRTGLHGLITNLLLSWIVNKLQFLNTDSNDYIPYNRFGCVFKLVSFRLLIRFWHRIKHMQNAPWLICFAIQPTDSIFLIQTFVAFSKASEIKCMSLNACSAIRQKSTDWHSHRSYR
jgi:hypothetical protein